ncbi:uncharacterized protein [Anabrus simplex]|uniref:uncharacterized protein n=1 Tax=Anabrus simplex TaxID=316456 RepID=UPI0035A2F2F3
MFDQDPSLECTEEDHLIDWSDSCSMPRRILHEHYMDSNANEENKKLGTAEPDHRHTNMRRSDETRKCCGSENQMDMPELVCRRCYKMSHTAMPSSLPSSRTNNCNMKQKRKNVNPPPEWYKSGSNDTYVRLSTGSSKGTTKNKRSTTTSKLTPAYTVIQMQPIGGNQGTMAKPYVINVQSRTTTAKHETVTQDTFATWKGNYKKRLRVFGQGLFGKLRHPIHKKPSSTTCSDTLSTCTTKISTPKSSEEKLLITKTTKEDRSKVSTQLGIVAYIPKGLGTELQQEHAFHTITGMQAVTAILYIPKSVTIETTTWVTSEGGSNPSPKTTTTATTVTTEETVTAAAMLQLAEELKKKCSFPDHDNLKKYCFFPRPTENPNNFMQSKAKQSHLRTGYEGPWRSGRNDRDKLRPSPISLLGQLAHSGDELRAKINKTEGSMIRRTIHYGTEYAQEYCRCTSLHGLQYLGEENRHWSERICWLLVIIVSIAGCTLMIVAQWNKWESSPVIVTFAESSTPTWKIPFPAVTICSEVKFMYVNYTDLYGRHHRENLTKEEQQNLEYASLICDDFRNVGINNFTDNGVLDYIQGIAPQVDDVFKWCKWRAQDKECHRVFTPIITDNGVCFSFNGLSTELFTENVVQKNLTSGQPAKLWSLEKGYTVTTEIEEAFPHHSPGSGFLGGLQIAVDEAMDYSEESKCGAPPIAGFKMMLHNPAVFPQMNQEHFRVPADRVVVVGVHATIMEAKDELRSYSPKIRKCYFEDERDLLLFSVYTQENCEFECFTNYTLHTCGCVAYYMPRTPDTPICGPGRKTCTTAATGSYQFATNHHEECHCLPACTEINYNVELSHSGYTWNEIDRAHKKWGRIFVFLKDMQITSSRRSELFGPTDFLANCGGLLGLFLGFSILSLVEIIYFITARLFNNIWTSRKSSQTFVGERKK